VRKGEQGESSTEKGVPGKEERDFPGNWNVIEIFLQLKLSFRSSPWYRLLKGESRRNGRSPSLKTENLELKSKT